MKTKTQLADERKWRREMKAMYDKLAKPVKEDGRICFGIVWFTTEADAVAYGKYSGAVGNTYNGGYFHGMSCGRDKGFDHVDPVLGPLFAATV